ncbi:MAG: hypothetical protein BWX62_00381 [Bacteroidetes bacterium ADurb.Bin037]|nr:MAG: hypothetical protein BWX62_00381 [Bacteroidetes bacterium ADurb.Bin037]HPW78604.1 DUF2764 family protein [Bacteroidales bacterium]HQB56053.1 DUF2764 family protein [Bacteroidales bacterium]
MANNYAFIIAGLPQLALDFQSGSFDLEELSGSLRAMLSKKDNRLLDWMEKGLKAKFMNVHFYRAVQRCNNSFIRDYFSFDQEIRNIIAAYTAKKYGSNLSDHLVGDSVVTRQLLQSKAEDFKLEFITEYATVLNRIMQLKDPLEREQKIDSLRWEKASELCTFHYLDIHVILAFLLKASLVARWARLDKETGTRMFRELVDEVKGTYKSN